MILNYKLLLIISIILLSKQTDNKFEIIYQNSSGQYYSDKLFPQNLFDGTDKEWTAYGGNKSYATGEEQSGDTYWWIDFYTNRTC